MQQSADEEGNQQHLQLQVQRTQDSLSSLMAAIGGAFAVHPALGLDENLRYECIRRELNMSDFSPGRALIPTQWTRTASLCKL